MKQFGQKPNILTKLDENSLNLGELWAILPVKASMIFGGYKSVTLFSPESEPSQIFYCRKFAVKCGLKIPIFRNVTYYCSTFLQRELCQKANVPNELRGVRGIRSFATRLHCTERT